MATALRAECWEAGGRSPTTAARVSRGTTPESRRRRGWPRGSSTRERARVTSAGWGGRCCEASCAARRRASTNANGAPRRGRSSCSAAAQWSARQSGRARAHAVRGWWPGTWRSPLRRLRGPWPAAWPPSGARSAPETARPRPPATAPSAGRAPSAGPSPRAEILSGRPSKFRPSRRGRPWWRPPWAGPARRTGGPARTSGP